MRWLFGLLEFVLFLVWAGCVVAALLTNATLTARDAFVWGFAGYILSPFPLPCACEIEDCE